MAGLSINPWGSVPLVSITWTSCLAPHASQQRRKVLSADENKNGLPVLITKPGKITLQTLVTGIGTINSLQFLNLAT